MATYQYMTDWQWKQANQKKEMECLYNGIYIPKQPEDRTKIFVLPSYMMYCINKQNDVQNT